MEEDQQKGVRVPSPTTCAPRFRPSTRRHHPLAHPLLASKTGDRGGRATDAMEEARDGDADANQLDETSAAFAKPRGARPILCGTYGCTLPNNHRGLHCLPVGDQGRSSRKRAKTEKLDEVFEENDPPASQEPDAPDEDLSDEDLPAAPPRPKPSYARDSVSQTYAPEARPIEAVAGLCKKTPYCQRYKNHPGARPRTQPPHAPTKPPRAEGSGLLSPSARHTFQIWKVYSHLSCVLVCLDRPVQDPHDLPQDVALHQAVSALRRVPRPAPMPQGSPLRSRRWPLGHLPHPRG